MCQVQKKDLETIKSGTGTPGTTVSKTIIIECILNQGNSMFDNQSKGQLIVKDSKFNQ